MPLNLKICHFWPKWPGNMPPGNAGKKGRKRIFEGRKQGRKPRRGDVSASKYDEKSLPEKVSFKRREEREEKQKRKKCR